MNEKKTSKKQLFEMMERVNPDLQINELFGWSKGEKDAKAQQAKVEQAKQEIEKYPPRNLFAQPARSATPQDITELKRVRINMAAQYMPTLAELMPVLFDVNQGHTEATDNYNGRMINGIIPANWYPIVIKNGYVDNEQGKEQLISRIDKNEIYE